MNGIQSILANTSLELEPLSIIGLYSYRFQIESVFRKLKQQTGAFCYHFWPKHMPKLSYYQKAGEPGPLERAKDERSRRNILKAVRATETRMALSCVSLWGYSRASLSVRLEKCPRSSFVTKERLPEEGCLRLRSWYA